MFDVVSRGRVARSVLAVSLLVLAAGACSSADDDDAVATTVPASTAAPATTAADPSSSSSVAPEPTDDAPGATRSVVHELGTSEVPVDPQRIVVVDRRGSLAFLLELGLEPVGALDATWLFGQPFHPLVTERAEAAGVEPIDDTDGPNLEQIALLEPDLIIGNVRDMGETADELAQLAPTIGLAWDFADPLANAVTIGAALDRDAEAQQLVGEFEDALAAAADGTADPGTVSIVGLFGVDDLRIYREQNLYGRLTEALGGEVVPGEAELAYDPDDAEVNMISMEQLGLAGGGRLISFVNLSPDADAGYRALVADPLVQALPAFQAGQVLEADPQLAFGAAGSTGIHAMLDQLVAFYGS